MRAEQYEPSRREQWDSFVLSNPEAGINHVSANFVLEKRRRGGKNRSLMLFADQGELIGVLPLVELTRRELRFVTIRELHSDGPLLKPDIPRSLQKRALATLVDHAKAVAAAVRADRIEMAYPPSAGGRLAIERYGYLPVKKFGFHELNWVGQFLDLRQEESALFQGLDSKCRNMIRRAQKGGAEVSVISDRRQWLDCYDIDVQTLGAHSLSPEAMEIVWDEFICRGLAISVGVQLAGQILSIVVISLMNKAGYYWLGFNSQPRVLPGTNNYALWEAILLCKKRGVLWFNLGINLGFLASQKNRNIAEFKMQFGGMPAYTIGGEWNRKPGKQLMVAWATAQASRMRQRLTSWRRSTADSAEGATLGSEV
jgi:hypothetical protein